MASDLPKLKRHRLFLQHHSDGEDDLKSSKASGPDRSQNGRARSPCRIDCGHRQTQIYRWRVERCEFAPAVNVPIRLQDDEVDVDSSQTLIVGDQMLFFLTGFTAAGAGKGSTYSAQRLACFLKKHHSMEPEALVAAIRQCV